MTKDEIFQYLQQYSVDRLVVAYAGGGGEGAIQDVSWFPESSSVPEELLQEVESWVNETILLASSMPDWCNQGGYGEVVLLVEDEKVAVEHNFATSG